MKRTNALVLAACLTVVVLYALWSLGNADPGTRRNSSHGPLQCYYETHGRSDLPDVLKSRVRKDKNVFFHETSCSSQKAGAVTVSARQACAIESAALMNPSLDVWLLVVSPAPLPTTRADVSSRRLLTVLERYPNVHVRHLSVANYFMGTPVEELYGRGVIETSEFAVVHMSDVLRFLTLWRFGGIYLDLDVVVVRPLDDLELNFSGLQNAAEVAAGIMSFSAGRDGGRWSEECLRDINRDYRPDLWSHNALGVLERLLGRICKVSKHTSMSRENCNRYGVFPPRIFYPVPWESWRHFFNTSSVESVLSALSEARTVHTWNKLSASTPLHFGNNSTAYEVIAGKFCPIVHEMTIRYDDLF